MMRPQDVLTSGSLEDAQRLVDATNINGSAISGTDGRVKMARSSPAKRVLMQYTVGLPLAQVPTVMAHSGAQTIWLDTQAQCRHKPVVYQALVSLAAMTILGVTNHDTKCKHAK